MSYRPLSAVVLAAGEGTRMRSTRPKPVHLLCGRPMVLHVLDALAELPVERVVVVIGHGGERVVKTLQEMAPPNLAIEFVEQHVQRGTGDAVSAALTGFPEGFDGDEDEGDLVVLAGDTPLLRPATLAALVRVHRSTDAAATLLTAMLEVPTGYGRVVRGKDDRVARIVEEADATDEERQITEVCTSIYCFRKSVLAPALRRLSPENVQGEYYLTDIVGVLYDAGYNVVTLVAPDAMEAAGVNDRAQLAVAEAELRDRTNERWMRRGVTMLDSERTYIDASVELAADVTLFPGTMLHGTTVVGPGARLGPDSRLVDCIVGEGAVVEQTVGRQAEVGSYARVGPFAVLDPGSRVPDGTVTGPFFRAGPPDGD
jgi:bifunctional UDP-N-acetylglucosamine pyrophosphorylase/glucosamine-1-phosphate N-acetyltransferase